MKEYLDRIAKNPIEISVSSKECVYVFWQALSKALVGLILTGQFMCT